MARSISDYTRAGTAVLREAALQAVPAARAMLLTQDYRSRREHYRLAAAAKALVYRAGEVAGRAAARMHAAGLAPRVAGVGQVHTVAFIPTLQWHRQLLPHLKRLGRLSHFDYVERGLDIDALIRGEPGAVEARRKMCDDFLAFVKQAAAIQPVDWIFVYASGYEILRETLAEARALAGAPIVGMCLDDKQSWACPNVGGQRGGQIDIAAELDIAWTSARVACEWYLVAGGNPLFLGEGCLPEHFRPGEAEQDVDVCFVGQAYGFRREFIGKLRGLGLRIETAGAGWPAGTISDETMLRLFQRSKVILGHGGIGWSTELRNVKGRDFDAPSVGTAAYVTTYNADLLPFFEVGRELACYASVDEAFELAARFVAADDERLAVARAGRARCVAEHTWYHRYLTVLETLGRVVRSDWPRDPAELRVVRTADLPGGA